MPTPRARRVARSILSGRAPIWVVHAPRTGGRVSTRGNPLAEYVTQAAAIKAARRAATGKASGRRSRFGIKVHTARGWRTIRAGSPAYTIERRGY